MQTTETQFTIEGFIEEVSKHKSVAIGNYYRLRSCTIQGVCSTEYVSYEQAVLLEPFLGKKVNIKKTISLAEEDSVEPIFGKLNLDETLNIRNNEKEI